jgi:hypothetical protein
MPCTSITALEPFASRTKSDNETHPPKPPSVAVSNLHFAVETRADSNHLCEAHSYPAKERRYVSGLAYSPTSRVSVGDQASSRSLLPEGSLLPHLVVIDGSSTYCEITFIHV